MMKPRTKSIKALTFSAALCASLGLSFSANAETIEVQKLKHAGPYPVANPWMADSVNVKGEKFSMEGVLDSPLSFTLLNNGKGGDCSPTPCRQAGCAPSGFFLRF